MKYLIIAFISINAYAFETHFNSDEVKLVVGVNSEKVFEIQMEAPSFLLLGYNNKPDTPNEKLKWDRLQALWFKNNQQLFSVDQNECVSEDISLELEIESQLKVGAILGSIVYKCEFPVDDAKLKISLKDKFKTIKQIELTQLPMKAKATRTYLAKSTEIVNLK